MHTSYHRSTNDEAIRMDHLRRHCEGEVSGELSRDRNVKDDNKRIMTGNAFATTANPVRREHLAKDCRVVEPSTKTRGGRPNQVVAIDEGQGRGNNGNRARRGVFVLGTEEALQDPNIVTGMFNLNNHYAATLFDSDADYRCVSTSFTPLLGIESSDLGFSYEIEIASGQLVEINKILSKSLSKSLFDAGQAGYPSSSVNTFVSLGMFWQSHYDIAQDS
ncbi:hypothetical protein Tco_0881987 [Tanacetum coccineum]